MIALWLKDLFYFYWYFFLFSFQTFLPIQLGPILTGWAGTITTIAMVTPGKVTQIVWADITLTVMVGLKSLTLTALEVKIAMETLEPIVHIRMVWAVLTLTVMVGLKEVIQMVSEGLIATEA